MTTWLKYVRHADIPEWEAKGWKVLRVTTVTHHEAYSVIMEWTGEGEPPK